MPEDINDDQSAADSRADGGQDESGKLGKILKILLPVGIIVLFVAAGHFASRFNVPSEAGAKEIKPTPAPDKSPEGGKEQTYYDLEPIVINLNEPQATRYLRVRFSFGIDKENDTAARGAIEKKISDINNWLIVYLSDLSIDDIRGAKNINRVRREVQDSLNDRLWPSGPPLIVNVSLKEWIVQ